MQQSHINNNEYRYTNPEKINIFVTLIKFHLCYYRLFRGSHNEVGCYRM